MGKSGFIKYFYFCWHNCSSHIGSFVGSKKTTFIGVTIGVITGVGGGIIRDIFAQEIPLIFKKEVYATASIAGAFALAYSRHFIDGMIPLYICFVTTVAIRLIALHFGIHQPVIVNKESVAIKD